MLDKGQSILIHCRGGLGRVGMSSARLLIESGVEPETAIERVRTGAAGGDRDATTGGVGQDGSNRPNGPFLTILRPRSRE
jgi:hypothetical protein